jgi:hypothetical protein
VSSSSPMTAMFGHSLLSSEGQLKLVASCLEAELRLIRLSGERWEVARGSGAAHEGGGAASIQRGDRGPGDPAARSRDFSPLWRIACVRRRPHSVRLKRG